MKQATIIHIFCILFSVNVFSQISTGEQPVSFNLKESSMKKFSSLDSKILPRLDMEIINKQDSIDVTENIPPRFGFPHKVNYDLTNSGTWTILDNGDKIWQLSIYCPGALSINLLYDKFWLPEGANFYIYSDNNKQTLGAFTYRNNKGNKINNEGFGTGLIYSDKITLEYFQPNKVKEQGIISVAYIIQGYKYIQLPENSTEKFRELVNCQVNVNCSEGQNWQREKNAVALILVNGNRYCTGSLINTTANDYRPLFLTADHCLGGWANDPIKYDAITNPALNHWSFYWNYESPNCANTNEPPIKSTVGATVLANNSISDFALLLLTEDPMNRTGVTPYYLGWDRSGNSGMGGVCIHHPVGDVKKIATHNVAPSNSDCFGSGDNNFWKINWQSTANGWSVTEGGSSGSPLINANHKVIGQLYGAGICSNTDCSDPSQDIGNYGKLSVSWTGNNATDSRRRLQDWLDPNGLNPQTLDGNDIPTISGPTQTCENSTITFSVVNPPVGFTWACSGSLSLVSSSGNSATFYAGSTSGTASVSIKVGDVIVTSKTITIGNASISISGPDFISSGSNGQYAPEASCLLAGPYTWKLINSNDVLDIQTITTGRPTVSVESKSGGVQGSLAAYSLVVAVGGLEHRKHINGDYGQKFVLYRNGPIIQPDFSIYPNPATDLLTIELTTGETVENTILLSRTTNTTITPYTIQLWNETRGLVRTVESTERVQQVSLQGLPKGMYFVHLIVGEQTVQRKILFVN